MIIIYCLRRPGEAAPPDGLVGVAGERVWRIEAGVIGAWISAGEVPTPDVEAVRAHDAVVRTALRSATPVPVRFGTTYSDEDALREALCEREDELRASLARVAGRVEMGLRVEWDVSDPIAAADEGPVASGRGYLDRRRREVEAQEALRARASALLDRVDERVAPEGDPSMRTLVPVTGVAGSMAHLVHRGAVRAYRTRVRAAQAELPEVVLRVTGPWAPYSFV